MKSKFFEQLLADIEAEEKKESGQDSTRPGYDGCHEAKKNTRTQA